ncbi:MAG: adenylyl-sulfate kinase [Actinomycetota bacterium]|nr:adenylyl-sulfate kinase [Actinomycetota bacterium]
MALSNSEGRLIWLTGPSGAGKSTIATVLSERLRATGNKVEVLDGDEIRATISPELGFSKEDRNVQIDRIGYIASLLTRNGIDVIVSAISPYRSSRDSALARSSRSFEVLVTAPLDVLIDRDTKGLYAKAIQGEITGLTGYDDPYEEPVGSHLKVESACLSLDESVRLIEEFLSLEVANA